MSAAAAQVLAAVTGLAVLASETVGKWLKTAGFIQYGKHEAVLINRITANKTEVACITWVMGHTRSVTRGKGMPALLETKPISTEEFQKFACAGLRATQESLERLCDEKLKILLRRPALKKELAPGIQSVRGWYVYSLPAIEVWEKLPAYEPEKKPVDSADVDGGESEEEPEKEPPVQRAQARSNGWTRVISKPLYVPSSAQGIRVALPTDAPRVKAVHFDSDDDREIRSMRISGDGDLWISTLKWAGFNAPTRVENDPPVANTELTAALAARAAPVDDAVADRFSLFLEAGLKAKLKASDEDWDRARVWFNRENLAFQLMLVADVQARTATGEFGRAQYAPKLKAYIDERRWTYPAWEKSDGRSPKQREMEEQNERGLAWAQSVDEKLRGGR